MARRRLDDWSHTNEDCATDYSGHTAAEAPVEDNRERLVDDDIGEKKCDQHPVLSLVEQIEDALSVLTLWLFGIGREDLQVDLVLAHERNGQTSKGTAGQDEDHGDKEVDPKGTAFDFGDIVVVIARREDRGRGSSSDTKEHGLGQPKDGGSQAKDIGVAGGGSHPLQAGSRSGGA